MTGCEMKLRIARVGPISVNAVWTRTLPGLGGPSRNVLGRAICRYACSPLASFSRLFRFLARSHDARPGSSLHVRCRVRFGARSTHTVNACASVIPFYLRCVLRSATGICRAQFSGHLLCARALATNGAICARGFKRTHPVCA